MQTRTKTKATRQTHRRSVWGLLTALALTPVGLYSQEEPEESKARFDPHRHLPIESLFHLHIPSVRGLGETLEKTLPGRVLSDPEVRAALGDAPERIRSLVKQEAAEFVDAFGKDPLELLELLQGELTLSVTGLDPSSWVSIVLAVELEDRREAFFSLLGNLERFVSTEGGTVRTIDIAGHEVRKLHLVGPPLHHVVLGDHLVLALSPTVLEGICRAFDMDAKGTTDDDANRDLRLVDNKDFQKAYADLSLDAPRLRLVLNVAALRGLAMQTVRGSPMGDQIAEGLNASGLSSLRWIGYGLGEKDGDVEGVVSIQSPKAQRGLIGAVLDSIKAPADKDAILARVPAGATWLSAYSVETGAMLKSVYEAVTKSFSGDFKANVDEIVTRIETDTGLSVKDDIFTLPRIEPAIVGMDAPGGGWIPDYFWLVRTAELAPYLKAFDKISEKNNGKKVTLDEGGTTITYRRSAGAMSWWMRLTSELSGGELVFPMDPATAMAVAPIDDQWSIAAAGPQPITRYLRYYAKGPKISRDGKVSRRFLDAGGRQFISVVSPSTFSLAAYNTIVSFLPAQIQFPEEFPARLELWRLPPGEKFLPALRHATMSLDWDDDGIRARGDGVVSAFSGYFAIPAFLGVAAGFTGAAFRSF